MSDGQPPPGATTGGVATSRSVTPPRVGTQRRTERARGRRAPIGAGRFYPADPDVLADTVTRLLDAVEIPAGDTLAAAYLVPHAGYEVSGHIAAEAYARLREHAAGVSRVIILSPDHDVELTGCVVSTAARWATPLGAVTTDMATTLMLISDGHAQVDDALHRVEHAIEVQLPFLQMAVPRARIVPVVVGSSSIDDIVITLSAVLEFTSRPGATVVICTSELAGTAGDARTLQAISDLAAGRIGIRDACGAYALRGLVGWAKHRNLSTRVLRCSESPAGYVACAFHPA